MKQTSFRDYIDTIVPGERELFPYQLEDLYIICQKWKKKKGVYLGYEMGLGKTVVSIIAWQYLLCRNILVICPGGVRPVWLAEVEDWDLVDEHLSIFSVRTRSDKLPPADRVRNVYVCSYDLAIVPAIQAQLLQQRWDLVIFDEAHELSTPNSKRTRMCCGNLYKKAERAFFLSGSLQRDKIQNAWPVFRTLCPAKIPGYRQFLEDYTYRERVKIGWDKKKKKARYVEKIRGGKNLKQLGKIATSNFLIRRKKKDVCLELPEKLEQKLLLEIPEELERRRMEEAMHDFSPQVERALVNSQVADFEINKIRRELGEKKIPFAMEIVRELLQYKYDESSGEGVGKLVVVCYYRSTYQLLRKALQDSDIPVVGINGETPQLARQDAIKEFQEGEAVCFLASYAAAQGLTLTAASTMLIVEMAWVLSQNEQIVDRLHRIGQLKTVYIKYLLFKDTLDMTVYNVYKRKLGDKKRAFG